MRRALASTAVLAAAGGYLVHAEVRRRLGLLRARRRAGEKLRDVLRSGGWLAEGLCAVKARLSESEQPVSLTVTVRDGGTVRQYTAKRDSGHVVVSVRKAAP